MERKDIATIINEKIHPFSLTKTGLTDVAQLVRKYPYEFLVECIDIGVETYFKYDENDELTKQSVDEFLAKLGGIAYNKSLSPINQEILHLKNKGKSLFAYWNDFRADNLLYDYVNALRRHWTEDKILADLRGESAQMMNRSANWSEWSHTIENWTDEVNNLGTNDDTTILQHGTILPDVLFQDLPANIQSLCKQINASYEHNLYDCTAMMMHRLLENLLALCYQGFDQEGLFESSKKELTTYDKLANYSSHRIWCNCTQKDIKPHIQSYRTVVEELLCKAGLKH